MYIVYARDDKSRLAGATYSFARAIAGPVPEIALTRIVANCFSN